MKGMLNDMKCALEGTLAENAKLKENVQHADASVKQYQVCH